MQHRTVNCTTILMVNKNVYNTKFVHVPLTGGLLHLVQRGCGPPSPLLAVQNVTAHLSTASVPITIAIFGQLCVILCIFVFLCDILLPSGVINDDDDNNGPLLCGFNVAIKGLIWRAVKEMIEFKLLISVIHLELVISAIVDISNSNC